MWSVPPLLSGPNLNSLDTGTTTDTLNAMREIRSGCVNPMIESSDAAAHVQTIQRHGSSGDVCAQMQQQAAKLLELQASVTSSLRCSSKCQQDAGCEAIQVLSIELVCIHKASGMCIAAEQETFRDVAIHFTFCFYAGLIIVNHERFD
jgi:hypothetical protein